MNENILKYLIDGYNKLAYTHNYIFGYVAEGMVYGAKVKNANELLKYICTLDRASSKNGGTYQLKYKPNKAQVATIITSATEIREICSVNFLENEYKNRRQNRGQIFEELSAKVFDGYQVERKNAKFTDCGDMIVKNEHFQVKFLKATFTDERTLKNLTK